MKNCGKCQRELPEGAQYCSFCGTSISSPPPLPQPEFVSNMASTKNLSANHPFVFGGKGLSFLWLSLWTGFLTVLTLGIFFPWAYAAQQRWIAANSFVEGRQLVFKGTGLSFLGQWLLIVILIFITFGIYSPWAYCRIKRWEMEHTFFADEAGPN